MSADNSDDEENYSIEYDNEEGKAYKAVVRDGMAKATFSNGDTFYGMYKDTKRNGQGTYTFKNKAYYKGEYVNNQKEGEGKMVFADGGEYTGEWKQNQRHGFGTYLYPNGDSYTGMWKDGKKHGTGVYTYVDIGSSMSGEWIANRCISGEWKMHDQSSYQGRFANNVPSGDGLFLFANKNTEAGRFNDSKWVSDSFQSPSPIAPLPKPVKASAFTWAARAVEKSVILVDHYEGISQVETEVTGVPNLRQSKNFPIWGGGQPSLPGAIKMIQEVMDENGTKVFWVSLRDTPVVYVNGVSFTSAARTAISRPMTFPDLPEADWPKLDDELVKRVVADVEATGGILRYWKLALADREEDVKKVELVMEVSAPKEDEEENDDEVQERKLPVLAPGSLFGEGGWSETNAPDLDVAYSRMKIPQHGLPSNAVVDQIISIARELGNGNGLFFCSQGGLARATTGMIIAGLVRKLTEEPDEPDDDADVAEPVEEEEEEDPPSDLDEEEAEEWLQARAKAKAEAKAAALAEKQAEEAKAAKDYKKGDYDLIKGLVALLGANGQAIKDEVDDVIDRCALKNQQGVFLSAQHHRECILSLKTQFDKTEDKAILDRGVLAIERYAYFLVIYYFLKTTNDGESEQTYSEWIGEEAQSAIREAIGTTESGPLSQFNFE